MAKRTEEDETEGGEPTKRAPGWQLWLEEAWEGWLKSVSVILLCALAYILYKFDLISEGRAGLLVVVLIVGGAIYAAASMAWTRLETRPPAWKALFVLMLIFWAAGSGYPALRAALPPQAYAEARLTPQQLSTRLKAPSNGPYEVVVSGQLKPGAAEAEASYTLKAEGANGTSDEISGELQRKQVRVRVSRRGGTSTSVQEVNEQAHRLPHVRGSEVTLTADGIDDSQLEGGLMVELRSGGLDPIIFLVFGGLAILLALFFDAKLYDPKQKDKTFLTAAAAITYVFAIAFPMTATPHSLVRPAVGALVAALGIGGIGGWILAAIARGMWGAKLPKKAATRR
jgi:hypothetical protein